MKKNIILLLALFFLFACQDSNNTSVIRLDDFILQSNKVARNVLQLTPNDAQKVANIFQKRDIASRSTNDDIIIKDIFPIQSQAGKTVMYVINYKDNKGYVIVGASKNFAPIIAFSEKGNIDINNDLLVDNILINEYTSYIQSVIDIEDDNLRRTYAPQWICYEEESFIDSRAVHPSYTSEQITQKLNEARTYYTSQGYDVHSLGAAFYLIPVGNGSSAEDRATGFIQDICSHTPMEYDCMDVSLFLYKQTHEKYGPLLETAWTQGIPYCADAPYQTAGCVTIAVTQLMYYYKWPTCFDWNNIRTSWGFFLENLSDEERSFMNTIREHLNLEHIGVGSTKISMPDMVQTFKDYEYSITQMDYNHKNAASYIINNKPLIMYAGQNTNPNYVHVWVCDGYKIDKAQYAAYMIESDFGEYMFYSGMTDILSEYFHMNLGLGESAAEGWFYQDKVIYEEKEYTSNRKMYLITKNNQL